MGRQIDRPSLKCFVTGFVINPSEITADYPDRWRKEGSIYSTECRNMFVGNVSSHREICTWYKKKKEKTLRCPQYGYKFIHLF